MSKKLAIFLAAIIIIVGATIGVKVLLSGEKEKVIQSHDSYSLNLQSNTKLPAREVVSLAFDIRNQNNVVLKNFDIAHEKKMHLIVVRKDRRNFQHVHPALSESSGMFKMDSFIFPTDGDYRLFADFTPSSAQAGPDGTKLPVTLYQDVQSGDTKQYVPQPLGKNRLTSVDDGFEAGFFISPDDDSTDIVGDTFYSDQTSVIVLYINKGGQAYRDLQTYLGALGHMVVLGPKLEFIHAHPVNQEINNQTGLIGFEVNFPDPGQYKIYLQTQADNQVNTFDYNLTVMAGSADQNSQNADMQGMQGMEGMQH